MENKNQGLPQSDSKSALQRLLIVLAIAIGILIYSYGWTVTEIDLTVPQEEQRQETLTRALRELLSPRIFDQERELFTYDVSFLMDCETGDAPAASEVVSLEPACGLPNDIITVNISGLDPNTEARLRWLPPEEEDREVNPRPLELIETEREEFVLDSDGSFVGTIEVPRIRGGEGQVHTVRALVAIPAGPIMLSETANQVIDRMVQTIFMALVATSVAIPIAALISFFAAHNLMRQVRLSVGSMLLGFIMFAVGVWLGSRFLGQVGILGITVGRGAVFEPIGALLAFVIPIAVLVIAFMALRRLRQDDEQKDKLGQPPNKLVTIISTTITTLTLIFVIGAIGGLGLLGGAQITWLGDSLRPAEVTSFGTWFSNAVADIIWSVGNILIILGTLVDLFIGAIVGVITGFALSDLASNLLGSTLRNIKGLPSQIIGAIMGALSGMILMMFVGSFGLWATLLGILPVLVGAILGGQVMLQIGRRLFARQLNRKVHQRQSNRQRWTQNLLFGIGFILIFYVMFSQLNVGRSLVDGTLPSQNEAVFLGIGLPINAYLFNVALVGIILGGISGFLSGLQSTFPLGNLLYNTSRTTLNIVRSIEPLIMGLVFVIWVGIGPFAGVLALTLHSIAALGKLYSEQIENIDPGPIEALQSTGANQLQTIVYAVVPQIIPPYIAFTMYRWDINVRMSTIIGFVGGGGIGLLLQQQINLLRYRDAGVAVLAIAVVVSILDYASAYIRERLT